MKKHVMIFVAMVAILPTTVSAQSVVAEGDRVRVLQVEDHPVVGILTDASAEQLTLVQSSTGMEHVIPLSSIERLDRSLGKQRRFGKYFGIGVASTAVVMGVVSAISWTPCDETGLFACYLYPETRAGALGAGLMGGAILGLPVGLILGLVVKEERWVSVSLPAYGDMGASIRPIVRPETGYSAGALLIIEW